jgi:DNA polymerase elongation subunit (family B)
MSQEDIESSQDHQSSQDYTSSIICQPYDINIKDAVMNDEGIEHVNIHLWCLDREDKPVLVRVTDFPAYCYVELPTLVNGNPFQWDYSSAAKVYEYLKWAMKDRNTGKDNSPFEWHFGRFQKLYYYKGDIKYPMILFKFRTLEGMKHCNNLLSKPRNVNPFGVLQFNIYEANIDIVRKFHTSIDATFCQWLNVSGVEHSFESDNRIATPGTKTKPIREISVSYKNIKPVAPSESEAWFTHPRILAYDIETYSDNHKAFPNYLNSKHVCNIISCIYYEIGNVESRVKYVIVLGDTKDIPDAVVIRVQTELELLHAFCDLIEKLDPEIISGYNIFAYDYPYLDNRLKIKLQDWKPIGRIQDKKIEMTRMEWKSGAYGTNVINILQMDGRLSIDMLPIVKRDYKLDKYSLEFVSNTFLGRGKLDVTPVEMFRAYERQAFIIRECKKYIQSKLNINVTNWVIKDKLNEIIESIPEEAEKCKKLSTRYELALDEVTRIVAYCIIDSDLVVDLFDKLNVWIGLNALSSVVGVTIMQLFTRGQQVRCLSQVYDKATRMGIVLDRRKKDPVFYEGGFVFEPKPGLYTGVICLDFASLYPSIMRAYNICFTTLVPQEFNDDVKDDIAETIEVNQEEPEDGAMKPKRLNADGEEIPEGFDNDDASDDEDESKKKMIMKTYKYKWVRKSVRYGVLPAIQDHLVGSRNVIKKEIAALEDELDECSDPKRLAEIKMLLVLKDKYSNALKVSANSLYGFLGAQESGVLALIEAAMCITATGRRLIQKVNSFVEDKYSASVVYGDSVSGDTPIFVMNNRDKQDVIRIDELFDENDNRWNPYRDSKDYFGNNLRDENPKQIINMSHLNMKVMTENGWTLIKKFIRHKIHPTKKMYRITTKSGNVDATEDHSLVLSNGVEVKPCDVKIGTKLLHNHRQDLYLNYEIPLTGKTGKVLEHSKYLNNLTYDKESYNFDITEDEIISIEEIYISNKEREHYYVYDLETENHHFAVGPGALVVHNTDSSMIDMHVPIKEVFQRGLDLAQEITYGTPEQKLEDGTIIPASPALFPPPLKIEFEKAMKMCCIKKKKYAALYIDKNGEFMREKKKDGSLGDYKILKRGIIVARRDTAKIVHKTYNKLLMMVLKEEPIKDSFNLIINTLDDLMNDRLPVRENLSIIRAYGTYKSDTYFMKIFGDELIRMGKPVNPSDRLEYVIVKADAEKEWKSKKDYPLGMKMRLIEMYEDSRKLNDNNNTDINKGSVEILEENTTDGMDGMDVSQTHLKQTIDPSLLLDHPDDPLRVPDESTAMYPSENIDYEYYIEHVLKSPLDQLFSIGYMTKLSKLLHIGYQPFNKNAGAIPITEPIRMISKMINDYQKQGKTLDEIKPTIPQLKEYFAYLIDNN